MSAEFYTEKHLRRHVSQPADILLPLRPPRGADMVWAQEVMALLHSGGDRDVCEDAIKLVFRNANALLPQTLSRSATEALEAAANEFISRRADGNA